MAAVVALLLGKPPERSPVLPEVIERLRAAGADVRVDVPRSGRALPGWLPEVDVVALRGLGVPTLEGVAAMESRGLSCCNSAAATLVTLDRAVMQRRLAASEVPVPAAAVVSGVDEARRWAQGRPVVLKSTDASVGRGAGVSLWTDPARGEVPLAPGPYLVQELVPGDGVDRKLYVIGARTAGLLKERATGTRSGEVFEPGSHSVEVARAVGDALDLVIYGVDLVEGPHGAVVVDVNAFPSCNGVADAATSIADTLLAQAR